MTSFNEQLKKIPIEEVLLLIIVSYLLIFVLDFFNIATINVQVINVIIILFFVFKLRDFTPDFKSDIGSIFSAVSFRSILLIVLANIFFSYGMLYLSGIIIQFFPSNTFLIPASGSNEWISVLSLISVVLISPIAEELLFRGVFLNKMGLIVPMIFAVICSSILFASLHSFGSIFSAFIFGMCMAILYLKSENILVPISAHFTNNLIGETIYHIDYSQVLFTNIFVIAIMSILAIVSFVFILKFITSNLKNIL